MNQDGPDRTQTPSLESVKELRLMAALSDLVRNSNYTRAARALGVNRKTVAYAMTTGRISPRIAEALERMLLSRQTAAEAEREAGFADLMRRVEAAEADVASLRSEMQSVREREQDTRVWQQVQGLGRRVAALESQPALSADTGNGNPKVYPGPPVRGLVSQVVTEEPLPGEEAVHGEAMPLVLEWRRVRAGHSQHGKGLGWLASEVRLLELEVELVERYGLTLPPEVEPLRGFRREDQIRWRKNALGDARRRMARAKGRRWVRRVLTLGLWWK